MINLEYEVKMRVRLSEASDIKYWSNPTSLNSLKSDLAQKFDVPIEMIDIELKALPNFKEMYEFLVEYAKELNKEGFEDNFSEHECDMRERDEFLSNKGNK